MELIIGIVVIFILLFCLGASLSFIATLALALVGLFILFMAGFFIYAVIVLITGKRTKGRFLRSETGRNSKIPYAVYLIGDVEYKNILPLEVMFQNRIYHTDRDVPLILNEKRRCCFDNNARICCILGIIVSFFLLVEMIVLLYGNI